MSKELEISPDLSLPIDAATQTFAFIARKGAGKTYAAGKLVEELMDAGVQCIILDAVGNWYGLRLAADGKGQGFDIPVLGGLRGDIPLEATGGELVADLVIETGRSIIIDISQFSQADRKRFATGFGVRIWQRKKAERDPSPVHLVIEESQLIIPQIVHGDDARMVGIFEEIIRLGRNYGIGVSMITQRPQSVNKEVLTQTECLIVLQVNGAPERESLRKWVVHQGLDVNLIQALPSLPVGVAYVWSPQWLKILQKVHIGHKRTFDASATPKVGMRRQQRELAPLDLDAFKERMVATIAKAKENDPSELKRTVAQLKRELAQAQSQKAAVSKIETKEVSVFTSEDRAKLELVSVSIKRTGENFAVVMADAVELLKRLEAKGCKVSLSIPPPGYKPPRPAQHHLPTPARAPASNGEQKLPKAERLILRVLANFPQGKTRREIGVIAGYKHTGGGFNNAIGALRSLSYIEGSDPVRITEAGFNACGPVEPLPTGKELYEYWIQHPDFGRAEREILRVLYQARGPLTKEQIAEHTLSDRGVPYEANGGGFNNAVGRLRTYELIDGGREGLQLMPEFFQ